MPVSNHIRRLLIETVANNINELTLGFDGTPATSDDGAAGRPAVTLTPTVTIIDDSSLLIEAELPYDVTFADNLREVYIQMRGTTDFTPVSRFTIKPINKHNQIEMKIQVIIEVM
tara:strand:+ start:2084 stop:2428 length:345 start_codon:yes stop_codon:yes gene_type:complete